MIKTYLLCLSMTSLVANCRPSAVSNHYQILNNQPGIAKTFEIPKNVHFIWLGRTLKDDVLTRLALVAKWNQDYKVTLWTDAPLKYREVNVIKQQPNFYVTDFREIEKYLPLNIRSILAQETTGFYNYAAYSDIMRNEILMQHGGIYIDIDTAQTYGKTDKEVVSKRGRGAKMTKLHGYLSHKSFPKSLMANHIPVNIPASTNDMIISSGPNQADAVHLAIRNYFITQYEKAKDDTNYYNERQEYMNTQKLLTPSDLDVKRAKYRWAFGDPWENIQVPFVRPYYIEKVIEMTGPGAYVDSLKQYCKSIKLQEYCFMRNDTFWQNEMHLQSLSEGSWFSGKPRAVEWP